MAHIPFVRNGMKNPVQALLKKGGLGAEILGEQSESGGISSPALFSPILAQLMAIHHAMLGKPSAAKTDATRYVGSPRKQPESESNLPGQSSSPLLQQWIVGHAIMVGKSDPKLLTAAGVSDPESSEEDAETPTASELLVGKLKGIAHGERGAALLPIAAAADGKQEGTADSHGNGPLEGGSKSVARAGHPQPSAKGCVIKAKVEGEAELNIPQQAGPVSVVDGSNSVSTDLNAATQPGVKPASLLHGLEPAIIQAFGGGGDAQNSPAVEKKPARAGTHESISKMGDPAGAIAGKPGRITAGEAPGILNPQVRIAIQGDGLDVSARSAEEPAAQSASLPHEGRGASLGVVVQQQKSAMTNKSLPPDRLGIAPTPMNAEKGPSEAPQLKEELHEVAQNKSGQSLAQDVPARPENQSKVVGGGSQIRHEETWPKTGGSGPTFTDVKVVTTGLEGAKELGSKILTATVKEETQTARSNQSQTKRDGSTQDEGTAPSFDTRKIMTGEVGGKKQVDDVPALVKPASAGTTDTVVKGEKGNQMHTMENTLSPSEKLEPVVRAESNAPVSLTISGDGPHRVEGQSKSDDSAVSSGVSKIGSRQSFTNESRSGLRDNENDPNREPNLPKAPDIASAPVGKDHVEAPKQLVAPTILPDPKPSEARLSSRSNMDVLPPELIAGVNDQIAGEVSLKLLEHVSEMRVMLKPESLGEVTISVRMEEGTMAARIDVSQQNVRTALEAGLPQLRDALVNKGIQVDRIDIQTSLSSSSRESSNQSRERPKSSVKRRGEVETVEAYDATRFLGYSTMDYLV